MEMTPEKAVTALLKETEAAHGAYETNVLGGVFDEEWPAWYATYLLDHGLRDRLPGAGVSTSPTWLPCWPSLPWTTSKGTRPVPGRMSTRAESSLDSAAVQAAKNLLPLVPQKFKLFKPFRLFKPFVEVV